MTASMVVGSTHPILIVDDSLTVRMDLVDAFRTAHVPVTACDSLESARAALGQGPISLIVLDVTLPDGDGLDFMKELRSAPGTSNIPIVLLSSRGEVSDRIKGLANGADEYVGKPYDATFVVARAAELIRGHVPPVPAASRAASVLIIDHSVTFREQLKESLEEGGYRVIMADAGEEGLRLAAVTHPDFIVVDGNLPGIDGATVVRRVRLDAALHRTPCVLLMASEDQQDELRALESGADAFLCKGVDAGLLLARLSAVLRSAGSGKAGRSLSGRAPKRLLAVDDSPTYLQELSDQMIDEGYDVVLARSGAEALELLAVQKVDCVLLDLMMPGMSGHETCRKIKTSPRWRDIPLVMLTGHDDRESMIEGLNAGADDYIAKSSDFEVLKGRLRAQLRRKYFEDETRRIHEELLRKELESKEAHAIYELSETRARLLSELEQKNQDLSRANVELANAQATAHIGSWQWDIAANNVTLSDELYRQFGLAAQDFKATFEALIERVHPEDRASVGEAIGAAVRGTTTFKLEHRYLRPDGQVRWMFARGQVVADASGKAARMFGVGQDITERRQADQALRDSEERFRSLAASSPIGIFQTDRDRQAVYVNEELLAIVGLSLQDALGEGFLQALWPDDRVAFLGAWMTAAAAGREFNAEVRMNAGDGRPKWTQVRAIPMFSSEGERSGWLGTVADIDSRIAAQQEMKRASQLAFAANRAKSEFLANMSHELRTPLNAIIGFSELLEQEISGPLTEGQKEFVTDILQSGVHLLTLVNDILDLSKIEAGRMEISPEWIPFGPLVEGIQSIVRPLAQKQEVTFEVSLPATMPEVFVDPVRTKQILFNLISNGIKFTPAGGAVRLEVKISGQEMILIVQDTGIGIAAHDLPRLFGEFVQLAPSAGVKPPGTGLGLALTKRFIELHGGSIGVESQAGAGTTFTAKLPLRRREG